MKHNLISAVLASGLLAAFACSGPDASHTAGSSANAPANGVGVHTLASGTVVQASIQEPISSVDNAAGQQVKAIVSRNVMDGGSVVIPGGAPIALTINTLHRSTSNGTGGLVALGVASITVGDTPYVPGASVGPVSHVLEPATSTTGDRDVVVTPGTPITITLTQPLKIAAK